ncbi:hypothetical protein GGS24DRAFT_509767 [Hypoxylon argillaceum]|nr:hypothetical protein GGS24DRAFT_509767 [Hypoxylon argillaceum]
MADREDSDQPRKRIAVATDSGTPRSAGDAENGRFDAAAIQEMDKHVLIVSSQETPFKDTTDFTYNLDAARTYAHHASRGPVSPLSPLPQYAHELAAAAAAAAGDGSGLTAYRQSPYPYSSKGYYQNMSGWPSGYQDDGSGGGGGVDYSNLNYSYQIINQEPSLVSGYGPYGSSSSSSARKSVYVDPETSAYSYGNLTHRPHAGSGNSNDGGGGQGFSLSGMAASLPSQSDKLHSSVNRTLTSGSSAVSSSSSGYRSGDGTSVGSFESPYATSTTLASAIAHRATAHADATYPTTATGAVATAAVDQLYAGDQTIRSSEEAGLSYVYGDSKIGGGGGGGSGGGVGGGGSRRDSRHASSSGGGISGSLLSNGHVYVPESHSAHPGAHTYVVPGPSSAVETSAVSVSSSSSSTLSSSSAQGRGMDGGATTPVDVVRGSGNSIVSGSSHPLSDSHRRSAGSLRGG